MFRLELVGKVGIIKIEEIMYDFYHYRLHQPEKNQAEILQKYHSENLQ